MCTEKEGESNKERTEKLALHYHATTDLQTTNSQILSTPPQILGNFILTVLREVLVQIIPFRTLITRRNSSKFLTHIPCIFCLIETFKKQTFHFKQSDENTNSQGVNECGRIS